MLYPDSFGNAIGDGIAAQQIGVTPQQEQQMESELSAQTKLSMQQVSDQVAAGNQASFGEAQSYFGTTPENTQIAIAAGNSPGVQYSPLTSNIDTSTFYQPNLNALASSVSIPQFDTSYTVQSGNSIAQIARDYYGDERYAGIILAANGMSSDYQSLSHLQVGTQLTLPDVSQLSGSQLNGALSAGGDIINDYQVTSDEVTARAQLAQPAANQQEQQASLDAFNSQADLTIQDTWEEPIITAKVGPMNPVDAFLMDHPTLGGALQGVADFLGTPQRINEGILNLEHDAVGGIESLFTGQSYQPQNGIVQLYANEGAGRGTVDLIRSTVSSIPPFSLAAAGNDQFALGRALPGMLGALAGFGELDTIGTTAPLTLDQRVQALLSGAPGVNITAMNDALKYRFNIAGGVAGSGTAVTDAQAFEDVVGPLPSGNQMTITSNQAAALENALGLPTGRLSDGGIISMVNDIATRAPRSPLSGNSLFLSGGSGLPGGGPELNIAPINTAGGGGIRQIVVSVGAP